MAEKVAVTAKTSESEQKCSNSCKQKQSFNSSGSPAGRMLQLQKTAGNQAVQRLIKSRTLQAKLRIGQPNDQYEQKADRVAGQIMRMPDPVFQRKCAKCDKDEKSVLRAKESPRQALTEGQDMPPIIHEVLHSPGQPLDVNMRAFMEPRFGHDFSRIRMHTDAKAAEGAKVANAQAFTVGRDIVFGEGEYALGTESGQRLMAHELTHVMQQNTEVISKSKEVIPEPATSSIHSSGFQANEVTQLFGSRKIAGGGLPTISSNVLQKAEKLGSRVTQPKGVKRPYKKIMATFDGKDFILLGDSKVILNVPGQSGRPYKVRAADAKACRGSTDDSYLNNPRYVGIADNGPIPEGEFTFKLTNMVMFTTVEQMKMSLAAEGKYIDPSGFSLHGDWGAGRTPLSPILIVPEKLCGKTRTRSGFYLHGGIMPGSSGCIDIGDDAIKKVAELLMGYTDPVRLIVKYTQPPPEVGFLSRAAGRFMYPPGKNPSFTDRLKYIIGEGD